MSLTALLAGPVLLLAASAPQSGEAGTASPAGRPATARPRPAADDLPQEAPLGADEARSALNRALSWIVSQQNPDGSWGTSTVESLHELGYSHASFYAWKLAGGAISTLALLGAEETPERRAALDRAVEYVLAAERPRRGNRWDVDNNWTALYVTILLERLGRDPRFQVEPWKARVASRAAEYLQHLLEQQDPLGGWGYYEGVVVSRRPTWSTSFSTACVIPALVGARELGWPVDAGMLARAVEYVRRCALPNGAYEYDLRPVPRLTGGESINDVKGSLGRIQVCNWARRVAGDPQAGLDRLRRGLEQFFEHHRFLDVARMRPIPHEAYYANAGYFYFFGHYYASQVVELLPEEEREAWHGRLRAEIVKAQGAAGQFIDFVGSFYSYTYATGFAALTLQAGLAGQRLAR
ncbi:MAG: terpene cyclase/mutase family protein [Planctomycetes bacterium]|nr:terpene cyclase/mutase family protein [Planctomycetota bacterium]